MQDVEKAQAQAQTQVALQAQIPMQPLVPVHTPDNMVTHAPTAYKREMVDWLISYLNWELSVSGKKSSKKGSSFRWANSVRDALAFLDEFKPGQFTKLYGSYTSKYKYHPQQQFENLVRHFDLTTALASTIQTQGTHAFYQAVCGQYEFPNQSSFTPDLTRLLDISSVTSSGNYLYQEILKRKGENAARAARKYYVRAYSRPVVAASHEDWQTLRNEMRSSIHLGAGMEDTPGEYILPIAISYKGKETMIRRRMRLLDEEGNPMENKDDIFGESIQLTADFVEDFRWSQVVRSCMAIAKRYNVKRVRIWVDRFVGMGLPREEKSAIYDFLQWEDFGLFTYAVCPVVRVYDANEPYFGTDFWRKLETVMAIAGRGLVLDDYMLRKYDHTIFYGPSLHQKMENGLVYLGGDSVYVRSVTLAIATALLTDGLVVAQANEHPKTKEAASAWKAWALRTISEGAYSSAHPCLLAQQPPFTIGLEEFRKITFWESMVSRSDVLKGNSYMDMSFQKSLQWKSSSVWTGIHEWVGMMASSINIKERSEILNVVSDRTEMDIYVATTGHVASIINLKSQDGQHKRSLVVELSRFSTARHGHVTAVAEATGLHGKKLLPYHMRFVQDPDEDQVLEMTEDGLSVSYKQMKFERWWVWIMWYVLSVLGIFVVPAVLMIIYKPLIGPTILLWIITVLVYYFTRKTWPWVDASDIGEGLFDNLLIHSIYDAGIKRQYRMLKTLRFDALGWH